jgi:hypothetical protein
LIGIVNESVPDDIIKHFQVVGLEIVQVVDVLFQYLELLLNYLLEHVALECDKEVVDDVSHTVQSVQQFKPLLEIFTVSLLLL